MKARLLVVDDEANIVSTLSEILSEEGHEVLTAGRAAEALARFEHEPLDLVLLDVMLPDGSGIDLLKRMKSKRPDTEVVMVSGHATVDRAVEAIRHGAYDFLEKPLSLKRVLLTVSRALERRNLTLDRTARRAAEEEQYRLVGESPAARSLMDEIRRVAPTSARVLVTGETGTGKELVAYWLHALSPRRSRPLVRINCAAIPKDLLESELFGHEKGAFTGAVARKPGKFELADTGTVFLDEIGDMDPLLQAKLLRALETGEFEPVGANRPLKVDIRVIAATNKNLAEETRAGSFREDLYHRLNVMTIHVPALRERTEDIPILARHFLDRYCRESGVSTRKFSDDAIEFLTRQPFPGNVRELKNTVERAAITTPGYEITSRAFPDRTAEPQERDSELLTRTRPLGQARDELEKAFLETQLARFKWNITRTAAELKIDRSNLSRRLKQLGISKPEPYA